jgi:hypothetical protein
LTLTHSQLHKTSGAQVWRGSAAATAATGFWILVGLSLGYGLEFLLGLWLFFLGVLPLEKGVLPWLAIGFFQNYSVFQG